MTWSTGIGAVGDGKDRSRNRRGGGWSNKSPDLGSHFQSLILPFPHPHPWAECCHSNLAKPTRSASLFSLLCRLSPRSIHSVPKSTGRKGHGGKGEPGARGLRPPRPHRGPWRGDRPHVSLGGAAHRDGGRAGRGRTEQAAPKGFLGPAPPPRSQRVKPGNKGGPGSGPHPWQHGAAKIDTAGGTTLPQHTSADLHPPPPFSHLRFSFPTPSPARQPPYPVPQSTTQAGSRPAIFLLACYCHCRRLLRADWGQGLAAGDRSYLTIHSRAAVSVRGGSREAEAVARKQQARSAATTSATQAGRQSPPCPAAASSPSLPSSSLLPPPYNFFPPRRLAPGSQDGRRCRRPGQARPRPRALPLPAPSGRGERACAVTCCRPLPLTSRR